MRYDNQILERDPEPGFPTEKGPDMSDVQWKILFRAENGSL